MAAPGVRPPRLMRSVRPTEAKMSKSIHTTIRAFVRWRSKRDVRRARVEGDDQLNELVKKIRYKRSTRQKRQAAGKRKRSTRK